MKNGPLEDILIYMIYFLLKMVIFHCYVSLPEGTCKICFGLISVSATPPDDVTKELPGRGARAEEAFCFFFGGFGNFWYLYPPGNGYISHQTGKGKSSSKTHFGGIC